MKRSAPLTRTRFKRKSNKAAAGRLALKPSAYRKLRATVLERDGNRCQACVHYGWEPYGPNEIHHVVKRSHGGADDEDNLITLCGGESGCHAWTDAAYSEPFGRLIIAPEGGGRFSFRAVRGHDKWEVLARSPGEGGCRPMNTNSGTASCAGS